MLPAVFRWLVTHAGEYDVVCVVDYRGVAIAAVLARSLTGRRVLIQGQTTGVLSGRIGGSGDSEPLLTRTIKWPLRLIYARADAIACISRVLQQEALAFGIAADRVHLLPNAIDRARFSPAAPAARERRRQDLGLSAADVVCVYVGRLSREKGILELVEAWNRLQPVHATLLVAGPDMPGSPWDAGPAARRLVDRHGLGASVRFLGPTTDVASLLQLADIAVQPSHFEALGLSAIEALACGVPVVASAVGGLPDFIRDGDNGRLVPVQDVDALAGALKDLITHRDVREAMAARARPSVADYDEQVVFARMQRLLDRLAAAAP
jgi:glycosyltransferase involved in cell wall biosynthesis